MSAPDALVIGAGHNGLTCAAFLARAGLAVTVVEARSTVGGCASTVDALGAAVNICNCDHSMVRASGIIEELDLGAYGLRYVDLDPALLSITTDGSAPWFAFHSVDRTLDSLRLTHPDQVDGYRRFVEAALPVARLLVDLASAPPTLGTVASRIARRGGGAGPRLLAWSRQSALAVLRRWFSAEALVAPVIAAGPAVGGAHPLAAGTGLGALGPAIRHLVPVGRPVGGSGALPLALARCVAAHGGTVRTGEAVEQILCDRDRVRGVALAGGDEVDAPVVISTVDPRTTLLRWLAGPPAGAEALVGRWRARPPAPGYEAKIDAVVDHRPTYEGVDAAMCRRLGIDEPLAPTAVITPTTVGIARAHEAASAGRIADQPVLLANLPSVPDPGVTPAAGGDVFSLEVLFTPYRLAGGWSGTAEPARWLRVYSRHVDDAFLTGVRAWRVMAPPDYEGQFGLTEGHAPSFAGGPLAALVGRSPELTRYETPIRGLFLSGAGTYPGAGVWGASGRNAASVVLRSRRR
ncbi:MAG: NAD(P)/FAD-dependent oxidoreductase [Actinomycetota bacterium]|nr:NAD(P)/FAD-dependent oxidoreductase [Actinomycetota bacterium]